MTISKAGTDTSGSDSGIIPGAQTAISHTLVTGSNRKVVVYIQCENGDTTGISGVTYGGQAMTEVANDVTGSSGFRNYCSMWFIDEANLPSDGANDCIITWTGTEGTSEMWAAVAQYNDIVQGAPTNYDTTAEGSPGDSTIENTLSAIASTEWAFSVVGSGNTGSFAHGQSQVETFDAGLASSQGAVAELRGGSSETSLDSTFTGTLNRLVRIAAVWGEPPTSPISIEQDVSDTTPSDPTVVTITAPTLGDLIVVAVSCDKDFGTAQPDTGFTVAVQSKSGVSSSGYIAYKISNGTETSVSSSGSSSGPGGFVSRVWVLRSSEGTSWFVDATASHDDGETAVSSQSTGTTGTTTIDDAIAIANVTIDTGANVSGPSWSNSFIDAEFITGGAGEPGLASSDLLLFSTQTVETTVTFSSGTDQMAGMVAVFAIFPISITSVTPDDPLRMDQSSVTIAGAGFEATQSTAEVTISDNIATGSGTIVDVTVAVTSWSDTSISLNLSLLNQDVLAALHSLGPGDGNRYVHVENASSEQSGGEAVHLMRPIAIALSLSGNIAASGADTTFQLTAPSGKTTGDFGGGRIQDDENPTDAVNLAADEYREDEWCLEAVIKSLGGQTYQFRILAGGVVLDTYTVDPRWTIEEEYNAPFFGSWA